MKTQVEIVIIGGGVMGCSIAYHLCKAGREVLLLEKGELTGGSTWHAAGQVTHSVSHHALAHIAAYATALYPILERETGRSCGWHRCGSLRVAYTDDEVDWLRHTVSVGAGLGFDATVIAPKRIAELHPFYNLDGVRAALHTPHDGHVDPAGVTLAMAAGAKQSGATIVRHNRATGVTVTRGGGFIIHTERGDITAHSVVNAGGVYARQIGAWVGLDLPIANLLHHYLVTESVPEFASLKKELPVVRDDREVSGYIRMEQRSALIGIYEKINPTTVWDDGAPWASENELFDADLECLMPWLDNAMTRMPVLADLGIKRVVRGAITHPADGAMLLGPSSVKNFWLCCGAQVGIAWAPGAGKYLAQWMTHGAADISLRSFEPHRFGARLDDDYRIQKAKEDYQLRHEIPYPAFDRPACRPSHSKTSPLHQTLREQGAVYENVFGWERPKWYATGGMPRRHIHSFRRTKLHTIVGDEVRQLRAHAGVADLTAFAKVEVSGVDAGEFLLRVSSNQLPRVGGVALAYFVLPNGRVEGEATVAKLGAQQYYLTFTAAREAALLNWLRQQTRDGDDVRFKNVSTKYGVLMVAGPKSREILNHCTDAPLDNENFPWLSVRTVSVAGVDGVRALRVTYTGELGWELHVPMRGMEKIYRALTSADADLVHIGSDALNAMRMEKGYRSGSELTNEVTMAEAGVLRFARNDRCHAHAATTAPSQRWTLACLRLDEPADAAPHADPAGGESVWRRGRLVGRVSSGGYGYAVGHYLAFAYLAPDAATGSVSGTSAGGAELEVSVLGAPRRAVVVTPPLVDARNKRPRA